jgi:hypothetical protein
VKVNVKRAIVSVLTAVFLTGSLARVQADEAAAPVAPTAEPQANSFSSSAGNDPDKWVFSSPLYIWAIGLTGTATLKGNNLNVDQSFTDLMDHMDQGFTAYLQLSKPQYGFYVNPNYYALNFGGKLGGSHANLDLQLFILEMGGYYRVWNYEGTRPAQLSVVGGARYWNLHENLHAKALGTTPNDKSFANSDWLLDPFIGLRFNEALTDRVHIMAQTDVGGFNLAGQTSRFSWQLMGLIGYDFTMPVVKFPSTVFAGWRQINVQKTSGSSTVNQDAFNLNFSGIMVGLNVKLF